MLGMQDHADIHDPRRQRVGLLAREHPEEIGCGIEVISRVDRIVADGSEELTQPVLPARSNGRDDGQPLWHQDRKSTSRRALTRNRQRAGSGKGNLRVPDGQGWGFLTLLRP